MSPEQPESESEALRALAHLVLRDHVASNELEGYLEGLLERLVELQAICRSEALLLSRQRIGLGPEELAKLLTLRAARIEEGLEKETL